jgi:hypothetical protein
LAVTSLCSATGNEGAGESNTHHGIFTQALLEGLAGQEITVPDGKEARRLRAMPDKDGAIFFHQPEGFLHERVKDLSKGQQHAVVYKPDGMRSYPSASPEPQAGWVRNSGRAEETGRSFVFPKNRSAGQEAAARVAFARQTVYPENSRSKATRRVRR